MKLKSSQFKLVISLVLIIIIVLSSVQLFKQLTEPISLNNTVTVPVDYSASVATMPIATITHTLFANYISRPRAYTPPTQSPPTLTAVAQLFTNAKETPYHTPTATPLNPKEFTVANFDTVATDWEISPDDQTLVGRAWLYTPEGKIKSQLWLLDINSRKVTKLPVFGYYPRWSPDGNQILFHHPNKEMYEIKIINKGGTNETIISTVAEDDWLDYYWHAGEQVDIVKFDGIEQINLITAEIKRIRLNIPANKPYGWRQFAIGYPNKVVYINNSKKLVVINYNGEIITIDDEAERYFAPPFKLSPDGNKVAYQVGKGPEEEVWVYNLITHDKTNLYRVEMGHIVSLVWHPNSKSLVIGEIPTGTYVGNEASLLWVDIDTKQVKPLYVDNVGRRIFFNYEGDKLFYEFSVFVNGGDLERTILYGLELQQ